MLRREFLKDGGLLGAALAFPGVLHSQLLTGVASPVRVRGIVRSRGRGVAGVSISDGVRVARTQRDGQFELRSSSDRSWIMLSIPAGYRIMRDAAGIARHYQPLIASASGEARAIFDLDALPDGDNQHRFIVLADPQTATDEHMRFFHEQTTPHVRATITRRAGVETFGVGCGDLVFDTLPMLPGYISAVRQMGVPFFQLAGNHDIDRDGRTQSAAKATFQRHFGPTYYSFDRGAVHYVVLDDVFWEGADDRYRGVIPDEQLAWLAHDLSFIERGRTVIVFVHIPVQCTRDRRLNVGGKIENGPSLYRLLEPYRAHIMSGHTHENENVFEGGVHEHVHGTVSGAWWSGPVCRDGTPNGYAVYDVSGDALRWQYLSTGFDARHQLRAYVRGADPQQPGHIVANVWNWDPSWTVVWYAGGERRGAMQRRTGLDPLTTALYAGPLLPARKPRMEPEPTDHLFYGEVPPDATDLRVEATDSFGNVYVDLVRPVMSAEFAPRQ